MINFTVWIEKNMKVSKDDVSAACNDYLKVLGLIALAYSWLKVLAVSYKEMNTNKKFFEDKIETANFFFKRVLPRIDAHYNSAISGTKYIIDFKFS
jgi:acyl-CoA dehydrogenase